MALVGRMRVLALVMVRPRVLSGSDPRLPPGRGY